MAAFAGLRGSGDFASDERPTNFRETILRMDIAGQVPITALLAKAQSEAVNDPKFTNFVKPMDNIRLLVNGEVSSSGTVVVVDSADPSASAPGIVYGSALNLKPGDMLLVEKTETSTYDNELIEVVSVQSATQFTVKRGAAGSTAATLPNDSYLQLMGSSYAEGVSSPDSSALQPYSDYNYCQIFRTPYEVTNTADIVARRGGLRTSNDIYKDDKMDAMWKHSLAIEAAILFGKRNLSVGTNGKPKRTMGGLRQFIPTANQTVFSSAVTYNSLTDALKPAWDFTSRAGDQRIIVCGNAAKIELGKIIKAEGQVQFGPQITQYGIEMQTLMLPFGNVAIKTHPLLNRNSLYDNSMFVLDFSALKYRPLRDTMARDDIQNPDEDKRKGEWLTEAGVEFLNSGLTMAYLGNISAS